MLATSCFPAPAIQIFAAGLARKVAFEPVEGSINDRAKRARAAIVKITPRADDLFHLGENDAKTQTRKQRP